jgi:hypothetical protein
VKITGKISEGVDIESIATGDTFYYKDAIYLKCVHLVNGIRHSCAVQLENGIVYQASAFNPQRVLPCKAEVHLEIP